MIITVDGVRYTERDIRCLEKMIKVQSQRITEMRKVLNKNGLSNVSEWSTGSKAWRP